MAAEMDRLRAVAAEHNLQVELTRNGHELAMRFQDGPTQTHFMALVGDSLRFYHLDRMTEDEHAAMRSDTESVLRGLEQKGLVGSRGPQRDRDHGFDCER